MLSGPILEALWQQLNKRMPESEATDIMNAVRDEVLKPYSKADLRILNNYISKCSACKNVDYDRKTALFNTTDPAACIILQRPNIGSEASELLMTSLDEAGFNKSNISLTYLNKCFPKNGRTTSKQTNNCRHFLDDELFSMKPKIVVACGKEVATEMIGPIEKISTLRGSVAWSGNYGVLVTYSPSYLVANGRNETYISQFVSDLKLAYQNCYSNNKQKESNITNG